MLRTMQSGRASRTAEMVCMGRAAAHLGKRVARFSDPTAITLLPPEKRERVERFVASEGPRSLREGMSFARLRKLVAVMIVRTLQIDAAITSAGNPQVVLLGAGLDGRAFRMPELRDAVVFEVDHPDSQRDKRARISQLTAAAREVRFVPVDFTRDSLAEALARAGHDPAQPTTFIWEGVVMYLTHDAIASTLSVIQQRSAPGSRLVVVYHVPSLMVWLVGIMVRFMGEPLRSKFSPEEMRVLLARYGYQTVHDHDIATLAPTIAPEIANEAAFATHLRIVVADHA